MVLDRAYKALVPGGVFYISLKYMPTYTQKIKEDMYGRRLFYFYNPEHLKELASDTYETVFWIFKKSIVRSGSALLLLSPINLNTFLFVR